MSVLLRRTTRHAHSRLDSSQLSEVFMVNDRKFTSASVAANDETGVPSATSFTFTLDNGTRFEAQEVRVDGRWQKLTAELVDEIVDGPDATDSRFSPAVGHELGDGGKEGDHG